MTSELFVYGCECVSSTSSVTHCVNVLVCACVSVECDRTLLLLSWPHFPQTSRWQNKQKLDKREAMAGLLLSKHCLDTWQAAIIRAILPSNHPSIQPTFHPLIQTFIHPSVSLTEPSCQHIFHPSINHLSLPSLFTCRWELLQEVHCQTSLFWLHVESTWSSGQEFLFCSVSGLSPSTSIPAKTTLTLILQSFLFSSQLRASHLQAQSREKCSPWGGRE